ncbi:MULTISPECIES: hypothetical protein [Halorussus]|uniref:hypothetical protein n=1 Tax=Halorussus TaxID=1070314 RepID=UPI0020A130BA|nr:hypothetical protein [Halorussus vallis]USZ73999.1 hypothetical protein NGM07_11075 [Halorussus vallis]
MTPSDDRTTADYAAETSTTPDSAGTSSLGATLAGYLRTDDRRAYAEAHGLRTRDGRVAVVAELRDDRAFPADYDATVTASHDDFAQAFVELEDLVALAADANVSRVRAPARPAADDGSTDETGVNP